MSTRIEDVSAGHPTATGSACAISPAPGESWAAVPGRARAVAPSARGRRRGAALTDRRVECELLARLADAVRGGESRTLVLRGEPGAGKTALLDRLVEAARGVRVARVAGVLAERELAFAGLHQLCARFSAHLTELPGRQREALSTAIGVGAGPAPDPLAVGLAVLGLLSAAAAEQPLLCVVDDEQWLDRESARTLGFVARRLGSEAVGLVVATRAGGDHLAGVPELGVDGLPEGEARALLDAAFPGPLDERARDVIVAETSGNPAALLELPSPLELAGGFRLPGAMPAAPRIEDGLRRRLAALPSPAHRLVELAATDPTGDPVLVRRAAERLGIPHQAAGAASESGLVHFGIRLRFRHPLARSVTYRSASVHHRTRAHAALAEVTDPVADADRRAWHRAHAVVAPDEGVAADLERSSGRAQVRGGLPAAAAFLERSVALTEDPARHAERILTAARTNLRAGAFATAIELLTALEVVACDESVRARADLLRGQVEFAAHLGHEAPSRLLAAARRLEPVDLELARRTYVDAWVAASAAGHLADVDPVEIALAARSLPRCGSARRGSEVLLDGLVQLATEGPTAAAPALRAAVAVLVDGDPDRDEGLRWGRVAATALWDVDAARTMTSRQVRSARAAGALGALPVDLTALAIDEAGRGDLGAAAALVAEIDTVTGVTGSRIAPCAALYLAALRGDQEEVTALVAAAATDAAVGGQGVAGTCAQWAAAILHNGHGRYADAFAAAEHAVADDHVSVSRWALPELVEAAARTGNRKAADEALARLGETVHAGAAEFGLGLEARSRALVSEGTAAETAHRDAIDHLDTGGAHPALARSHLLYGEWLRRETRRVDARRHLRTAHEMLQAIGMTAFAERARRELLATGESVRRRALQTPSELTSQEASIARLAADGQTNAEIGAQLFLSARTIEWHLRKVFTKLGVGSRRELRLGLSGAPAGPPGRAEYSRGTLGLAPRRS
ncbi:LuxR C-terminal-related transcriptional regulator [Actinomycetospora sp. TBRC 11914]|uniref:helix-turn-helix transcriptional regulator n=1 Tax=Actinomycetospora sp. TBRC 11914 TaxID=2729387 RepID=UPI00289EED54|nr:LuxR C-terminal-related transcriptional regulator [Actinomycetospora sp. TBRC 11914]